jgi:hypothetical protein
MIKLGYNEKKSDLIQKLKNLFKFYFTFHFRGISIEMKIKIEYLSNDEVKIINLVSNIAEPSVQFKYKQYMAELFSYIFPPNSYVVIVKNNGLIIRTNKENANNVIKIFKKYLSIEHVKKLKYKTIYTLESDIASINVYNVGKLFNRILKIENEPTNVTTMSELMY